MDYFKLGEVSGKAWRLGHMGEEENPVEASVESSNQFQIPEGELYEFYDGFHAGVRAIDAQAAQVHETSLEAPSNASEH